MEADIQIPAGDNADNTWDDYWEHLDGSARVFRVQSELYVRNLTATGLLSPDARVLDFGCGFGYVARGLAPLVGEVYLWDAAENMRKRARQNAAGFPNVHFVDFSSGKLPRRHPEFDLILVNSVIQYMTQEEFAIWLANWRETLAPGGRIVVSDIIPPGYNGLKDVVEILKLSARHGFLLRAAMDGLRDILGYWKKRRERALTTYSHDDLTRFASEAGLTVEFLPHNLTHFPRRTTAVFSVEGSG